MVCIGPNNCLRQPCTRTCHFVSSVVEIGSNSFGHTKTRPPKRWTNGTFWREGGPDGIEKALNQLGKLFQPRSQWWMVCPWPNNCLLQLCTRTWYFFCRVVEIGSNSFSQKGGTTAPFGWGWPGLNREGSRIDQLRTLFQPRSQWWTVCTWPNNHLLWLCTRTWYFFCWVVEFGSNSFGHTKTGPPKRWNNGTFWLEGGRDWIEKDLDQLGTLFQQRSQWWTVCTRPNNRLLQLCTRT